MTIIPLGTTTLRPLVILVGVYTAIFARYSRYIFRGYSEINCRRRKNTIFIVVELDWIGLTQVRKTTRVRNEEDVGDGNRSHVVHLCNFIFSNNAIEIFAVYAQRSSVATVAIRSEVTAK